MAKISFSVEHKSKGFESYPKLKLSSGEKARVCLIDQDPDVLFVHTYRMPVVVNGVVQKETRKGKRGDYEVDVTEYVGQWACTGDYNTVAAKGTDAENCVQCAKVLENPSMYTPPNRRFGQHILRYKTKPNSHTLAEPFGADLLAWVYSESRYDELVDFATEHGEMRLQDLNITCISGDFQNYQTSVAAECQWTLDDARQQYVKEVFQNNKAENMENLIARKATEAQLALDFDKVEGRHGLIGRSAGQFADEGVGLGADDLDNLFTQKPKTEAPDFAQAEAPAKTATAVDDEPSYTEDDDDDLKGFDDFLKSM